MTLTRAVVSRSIWGILGVVTGAVTGMMLFFFREPILNSRMIVEEGAGEFSWLVTGYVALVITSPLSMLVHLVVSQVRSVEEARIDERLKHRLSQLKAEVPESFSPKERDAFLARIYLGTLQELCRRLEHDRGESTAWGASLMVLQRSPGPGPAMHLVVRRAWSTRGGAQADDEQEEFCLAVSRRSPTWVFSPPGVQRAWATGHGYRCTAGHMIRWSRYALWVPSDHRRDVREFFVRWRRKYAAFLCLPLPGFVGSSRERQLAVITIHTADPRALRRWHRLALLRSMGPWADDILRVTQRLAAAEDPSDALPFARRFGTTPGDARAESGP